MCLFALRSWEHFNVVVVLSKHIIIVSFSFALRRYTFVLRVSAENRVPTVNGAFSKQCIKSIQPQSWRVSVRLLVSRIFLHTVHRKKHFAVAWVSSVNVEKAKMSEWSLNIVVQYCMTLKEKYGLLLLLLILLLLLLLKERLVYFLLR